MSALQEIEERDEGKPILCIVSEDSILTETLLQDNYKKFKIIFISSEKIKPRYDILDLYSLTYEEAQILPKLKEKINYSIIIETEERQEKFLPQIVEKLKSDKAKSLLLIDIHFFQENLDLKLNSKYFYVALLGEVIGKKKTGREKDLSRLIHESLVTTKLNSSNNSSTPVYPIFLKDALENIYRLLFGSFKKGGLYLIFYHNPETLLSAIHIMGRVNPDIDISFSDTKAINDDDLSRKDVIEKAEQNFEMKQQYLDENASSFEEGLSIIYENKDQLNLEKIIIPSPKKTRTQKKIGKRRKSFMIKSIFGGIVLFIMLNFLAFGASILLFKSSLQNIEKGDFKKVYLSANASEELLKVVRPTAYNLLDLLLKFSNQTKSNDIYLLFENSVNLIGILGNTASSLTNTYFSTQKIESLFSNLTYLYLEGESIFIRKNDTEMLSKINPVYSKLLSFSSILRPILGYGSEQRYLILFQNSNELRPGGGFIGSIGDITVNKGNFSNLQVHDVYELDGQLRVHFEPPFIVRRYLQPHLYLRDTNFYLDFEESAKKAATIYNFETGKLPNVVIAVNLDVLEKIVKIIGSIDLPEYKMRVDEKNISTVIQNTIQSNNFPGSTAKKDILNKILNQIILRIQSDPKKTFEIAKIVPDLLEEKSIMIAFDNDSVQKIFRTNGYSGSLEDLREIKKNTSNDFLYVNESNIGVNKVNSFVERSIKYDVTFNTDSLKSLLKISLKNKSLNDDYKAYIQIAVPKGSRLEDIKINGVSQELSPAITDPKIYENKNFKAPLTLEVEQYITKDNFVFSFVTTVPKENESTIDISYSNGAAVTPQSTYGYSLRYIKQPGTKPYQFTTSLYFPENYSPAEKGSESPSSNFISKSEKITKDFNLNFELRQNQLDK